MQTDAVLQIPCGSKGGTMIEFSKVEVVNRLDKDAVLNTLRLYGVHYGTPPFPGEFLRPCPVYLGSSLKPFCHTSRPVSPANKKIAFSSTIGYTRS